jgi:RNA methyltransferase, TrmH family
MAGHIQRGNPAVRPLAWYKSLSESKARWAEGFFLVEGPRAIKQILQTSPERINELLIEESASLFPNAPCPVRKITGRQLSSIACHETPQGCIAVVRLPSAVHQPDFKGENIDTILVCEEIQDPGNVGNLVRSAAAFGFGVVFSESSADPFGPKAVQASAGAITAVAVRRTAAYREMTQGIKQQGFCIIATTLDGIDETSWTTKRPAAILLGNEGTGLSKEMVHFADIRYRIPHLTGKIESLNVASAGAICMHQVYSAGK